MVFEIPAPVTADRLKIFLPPIGEDKPKVIDV